MDYDAPLWSALRYIEERYNVVLTSWGVDDIAYKILELKGWDEEQMPKAQEMAREMWTDELKGTLSDQLNQTSVIDDVVTDELSKRFVNKAMQNLHLDDIDKLW